MRPLPTALRRTGWLLLAAAAAAGVIASAGVLLALTPAGRPVVAGWAVGAIDRAIAGSVELDGLAVLAAGGVEARGLRITSPGGTEALRVERARIFLDVTRLRSRELGLAVELEEPAVDLSREPDGALALGRAFSPAHPAPGERPPEEGGTGTRWTLRVSRLTIRGGTVRSGPGADADRLAASGLDLEARGELGPRGARVEAQLRGRLDAPLSAPIALDAAAALEDDALSVPLLSARLGENVLEAVGEGDVERRTARVAVLRLGIQRGDVAALVPGPAPGGDLSAAGFLGADGALAAAALRVEPSGAGARGRADAVAVVRLPPAALALGFDVRAHEVDPARLLTVAPPGSVTLDARGAWSGASLETARARLAASISRSALRGVPVGPAEVVATARDGEVRVSRLVATLPGGSASASGRWARRGAVAGEATVESPDLARLSRALEALLGTQLPPLAGSGRVAATLSGTAAAPALRGSVSADVLRAGGVSARGVRLDVEVSGPLRTATGRVAGTLRTLDTGAIQASALRLRGEVDEGHAALVVDAAVPAFGKDPVSVRAGGRFGPERQSILVSELEIAYPGTRFALERPARIALAGPSVDRLAIAAGPQRIAVEGGLDARGALDARVEVAALDLASLPRGVLPESLALAGTVAADVRATGGSRARGGSRAPSVEGRLALASGSVRGVEGLDAEATVRLDAAAGRWAVDASLRRAAGGTVQASLDLPLPLARASREERVAARVRADRLPLDAVLRAAGTAAPLAGALSLDAVLDGAAGAPSIRATASLADAALGELDSLAADASVDAGGERARASARVARLGAPLASLEASAPLDLRRLVSEPAAAVRDLARAPLQVTIEVPGAELAALAGVAGLPEGLAGLLRGSAEIGGSAAAPRGRVAIALERGEIAGYAGLGGSVEINLAPQRTSAAGVATLQGEEVLRADAALEAPPERLLDARARPSIALRANATLTEASLAAAAKVSVPLSGRVEGSATVGGTLGDPTAQARLAGAGLTLGGRPLGDVSAQATYAERRAAGGLTLRAAAGGTLSVSAALGVALGSGAERRALRDAPASLRVVADALDLGVAAVVAPDVVRSASGRIAADLADAAPLRHLRPRGKLRLDAGRIALADYGEFGDVVLDAAVTDDAVEIASLSARRGAGRLDASASVRGLAPGRPARIEARLDASAFAVSENGMDLATVDARIAAEGTLEERRLDAKVTVVRATVRLPERLPRELQSLERRPDIEVGPERTRKPPGRPGAGAEGDGGMPPFEAVVHVVAPERIEIRSAQPRVDVDLRADVTLELVGRDAYAEGTVQVVRGEVEPIRGRTFVVQSGRVEFTGGPPKAAVLDVRATWEHASALVTVNISGPIAKPEIQLSSKPPMDDAAIAMLIATGQTEVKAGTGAVGALSGEEAGRAAAAAVFTQVFNGLVAGKLPLDTVSLDASTLRAGVYVKDQPIYVGYVRRFDAKPEEGENVDEVRVEYRITPRWKLEVSWGSAQSGAASLMWSKDY